MTNHHPMNCNYCGKFVSYRNQVCYTPYGSNTALEPPDEEFICLKCWDDMKARGVKPVLVAWIPPVIIRDGEVE